MAPRSYTLGHRATSAAATRRRVLEAATDLYRERGIVATTIQAVAERADVSRGTILNHFAGADGLLDAVLDHVLVTIDMPDERVLDGAPSTDERIRRFVAAMFDFYERSSSWWTIFGPEMQLPALQAREQAFNASIGRFQAAALGPIAGDPVVAAAVAAFVHPHTLGTMRVAGASLAEVTQVIGDALVDLVARQQGTGPSPAA